MKKRTRQMLALICAFVLALSLVGCSNSEKSEKNDAESTNTGVPGETTTVPDQTPPDPAITYKETVKISSASELTGVGYYSYTNQFMSTTGRMTLEGLFRFNYETGSVENLIAKEATDVNGDGRTWRITIHEGVTVHYQGKAYGELKANDIKFTYEFLKPDGPGYAAGVVARSSAAASYVDEVEIVNDYEVIFHLNAALFDFPVYVSADYLLCEAAMNEFGFTDGQEAFTGPYYIDRNKSVQGQQWVLARFDDYWGGIDNYPTKTFVFVIHTDQNTGAAALEAGEVDALINSDPTIALQFQSNPAFTVHSTPGTTVNFLGFNSYDGTGFFDDEDDPNQVKLRQAISLAIDRDEIVSILYATNPTAGSRVDSHFNTGTTGYVDLGQFEYDVEKAKGLMEELGYGDNNRLGLKLVFYSENSTYAQIIQSQLKKIYIDVECSTVDRSQFGALLRTGKDWDMAVNYYATVTTLGTTMVKAMTTTGSIGKTWGWSSAETDAKVENVMAQSTAKEQETAFAEFQEWIRDYVPRIPTHTGSVMIMAKADVEGIVVCPDSSCQNFTTFRIPE